MLSCCLMVGLTFCTYAQQLITYSNIPGRAPSEHYTCRVKFAGETDTAWREVFVMQTKAKDNADDEAYFRILSGWTASWVAFESDFYGDSVVVEISKKDGSAITKAMVRPVAAAQPAVIENGKAYVTFSKRANINVDINGQMEDQYTGFGYEGPAVHTISIFANPLFRVPDTANSNVKVILPDEDIRTINRAEWDTLVFAPGMHHFVDTVFEIHSNEVLFIPGDAIVKGNIHPKQAWGANSSKNFTVYGSGTISSEHLYRHPDDDDNKTIKPFTYQGQGAHLEGFVVADPAFHTFNMNHSGGDTTNINVYKNLKVLAWRVNSDGINAFRYSEVSDCFFRTQDDAFYLGATGMNQHDNVVWNDANGAVLFLPRVENASTCTFRDVTVIYHRAQWHWWSGGRIFSMRETAADATIANVHIQNILVEDPLPWTPPFTAEIREGEGQTTFRNILIENVRQEHDGVVTDADANRGKPQNRMIGLDEARKWENVTFKNCYFNGKWLTSFGDGDFDTTFVDTTTVRFEVSFPIVDFMADTDTVSLGEMVQFTDATTNEPFEWSWTFEGGIPASSTEQNPTVSYAEPGTYAVTLIAINEFGADSLVKSEYIRVIDQVLSVDDEIEKNGIRIYPNPTNDFLKMEFENAGEREILILDLQGRRLYQTVTKQQHFQVDVSKLQVSGIVIIQVKAEGIAVSKAIHVIR